MRLGLTTLPTPDPAQDDQGTHQVQRPLLEVLLIGPGTPDMLGLEAILCSAKADYSTTRVEYLQQALDLLQQQSFDMLLLDLTLTQCPWRAALEQLANAAPQALRIGLADGDEHPSSDEARCHGAHDTITLPKLDAYWLLHLLDTALHLNQPKRELDEHDTHLDTINDALPIGTLITDMQGTCCRSNARYRSICGQAAAPLSDRHWTCALHPDDRSRATQEWQQAFESDTPCHIEARILRPDNSIAWVSINAACLSGARGYIHTVEDITSRKQDDRLLRAAEEALYIEKERAQVTLNSIGDAVISTDNACRVTYLNRVAEVMTGWPHESALGRPITDVFRIVEETSRQPASDPARRAIDENRIVGLAMGTILIGRDGSELAIEDSAAPIHDRSGEVTGAVIVFHHVNQSLTIAKRMSHLALHDALTDLPNRVLLRERLTRAIGLAQRHRQLVALLFIDLDDFKAINDRLGHAAGDALLQCIARRLKSCVRDTDTVCRLGGDEFVILLTEVSSIDDARQVAEAIFDALLPPHYIGERTIDITASLGISLYPNSGSTPDELMHRADTAMYHIKRQGRNSYQFFSGDMLPSHSHDLPGSSAISRYKGAPYS
ncbi:diguanylate cyclase [Halomonas sp. ML-15]|uniref:bifunctional diguanylate cyclase/phosphodiesterase n=1 Tax=Halomonas sp. ML-15 TaxID=2773305 RepID=UPI001747ACB8|nr:bifunctional diguanylate cyclase/phosphodiesterase [Halomonas sp. ML-15]MBD3894740.1 diguanylate cyclase [Halomonas sp. ML-15]